MIEKQIFTIHFAGGDRYSYRFLNPYLKDSLVTPIELSGRGCRINEPFIHHISDVIGDVCQQIIEKVKFRDFVLYGHSLGGILAFHTIKNLRKEKLNVKLVISGNAGPLITDHKKFSQLSTSELKEELIKMGGTSGEVLNNNVLFNYYEPIIRYDFSVAEKLTALSADKVDCPISCLMGSEERFAGDIKNWLNFTNGHFDWNVLAGNHFFIHKYPQIIAKTIVNS